MSQGAKRARRGGEEYGRSNGWGTVRFVGKAGLIRYLGRYGWYRFCEEVMLVLGLML